MQCQKLYESTGDKGTGYSKTMEQEPGRSDKTLQRKRYPYGCHVISETWATDMNI